MASTVISNKLRCLAWSDGTTRFLVYLSDMPQNLTRCDKAIFRSIWYAYATEVTHILDLKAQSGANVNREVILAARERNGQTERGVRYILVRYSGR